MHLLDFLFPKRCVSCKAFGSYVCPDCFARIAFLDKTICLVCQRPAIAGVTHPACKTRYTIDGTFSSLVYSGVVKRLVYQFKFAPFVTDLKSVLIDLLYEGLIQQEQFYSIVTREAVFVPIPLHGSKLRKRGYNQSFLLAQGLSKKLTTINRGTQLSVQELLERVKKTQTQVGLTRSERKENIKEAFALKAQFQVKTPAVKQVILVDDIMTSGATLLEAAKILKRAGVEKVWGVTLAHGL